MIGDADDGDGDDQVEAPMPGIIFSVPAHFYPLPPSRRALSTEPPLHDNTFTSTNLLITSRSRS